MEDLKNREGGTKGAQSQLERNEQQEGRRAEGREGGRKRETEDVWGWAFMAFMAFTAHAMTSPRTQMREGSQRSPLIWKWQVVLSVGRANESGSRIPLFRALGLCVAVGLGRMHHRRGGKPSKEKTHAALHHAGGGAGDLPYGLQSKSGGGDIDPLALRKARPCRKRKV